MLRRYTCSALLSLLLAGALSGCRSPERSMDHDPAAPAEEAAAAPQQESVPAQGPGGIMPDAAVQPAQPGGASTATAGSAPAPPAASSASSASGAAAAPAPAPASATPQPPATPEFEQVLAELRRAGEPASFKELEAMRAVVPPEEDSVRALEPYMAQLTALGTQDIRNDPELAGVPGFGRNRVPDWPAPFEAESFAKLQALLDRHAALLAGLEVLADKPRGRFQPDYESGPISAMFPMLEPFITGVKLKSLHIMVLAQNGELEEALRQCGLLVNLYSGMNDAPILLCAMMSITGDGFAADAIERALARGVVDAIALQRLEQRLAAKEQADAQRMLWAFRGERTMVIEVLNNLRREIASHPASPQDPSLYDLALSAHAAGQFDRDAAMAVRLTSRKVQAAARPLPEVTEQVQAWEDELAALPDDYRLTKVLLPSIGRTFLSHASALGQLRCARTGLAVERYRLAQGSWPEALDALVPTYMESIPDDPFDGQPLRFRKLEDRVVIYTISEDRQDDGGVFTSSVQEILDMGFRLLNPERRGATP